MADTKIEWSNKVWNPVTGCSRTSDGCRNCYAERMARRLAGRCGYPEAPNQFKVTPHTDTLREPLHWRKPVRIFVDSMGDLFHKDVFQVWIAQILAIMTIARQHTYMVLTKRPERMAELMDCSFSSEVEVWQDQFCAENGWCPQDFEWPLPNLWLGVSVENQDAADERIPLLLKTSAVCRFVSYEPALAGIDLRDFLHGLDWVIAGCESGPEKRPAYTTWFRRVKDQCEYAGVKFFMKQMEIDGKVSRNISDFPLELQAREFPEYSSCSHVRK